MPKIWQDFLHAQGYFDVSTASLASLAEFPCLSALTDRALLSMTGNDAKKFLQGQITANVNDVTVTKSTLGAHCNLKGRMQSLFRLFLQHHDLSQESYYLALPKAMLSQTQANFKKYALFSKVVIETEQSLAGIGLYGANIGSLLTASFPEIMTLQQPYDYFIKQTSKGVCSISRLPGQHPRFEIWGTPEFMITLWSDYALACKIVAPQAWELLDIQAGLPTIYPQTIDEVLPHHANLSILNGISYTKGCYLGQEIIARMQYRGKIKKHLYRGFVQGSQVKPEPGAAVCCTGDSASEPGIVLRAAENASKNIELLMVLDDQFNNFENVFLYSADGPKIHRLDLPYTW